MESELKARSFWALARLKGKIWLNAEHLGGCAFRFVTLGRTCSPDESKLK
ncbi:TPA: hypothetical protein R9112_001510 [Campylobacter upsaliensis]|nr:hypothetical protein [Campylobacter upsaliensis]